ncbi:MAG: hypothetical protein WC455_30000 [Dehalococcoidia bacterium]|jgi:hypothetical protein
MAKTKVPKEEKKVMQTDLEGNEAKPVESVNEKTQTIVEFSVDGCYMRTTKEAVAKIMLEDDPAKIKAFVQARVRLTKEILPVPDSVWDERVVTFIGMLGKYRN